MAAAATTTTRRGEGRRRGLRRTRGGLERGAEFLSRYRPHRRNVRIEAASSSSPGEGAESVFSSVPREALDMKDSSGRLKRRAKIYHTHAGERLLFQFGESMRRFEVPEGTRVIYPGVRKDGERNIDKGTSYAKKRAVRARKKFYPISLPVHGGAPPPQILHLCFLSDLHSHRY